MNVHLHYAGMSWALADGVERTDCQSEIMRLCAAGGGVAEFDLAGGGTIALTVGSSVPIAVTEKPTPPPPIAFGV